MSEVFICGAIRTSIGRHGGTLSSVRTDDLATTTTGTCASCASALARASPALSKTNK